MRYAVVPAGGATLMVTVNGTPFVNTGGMALTACAGTVRVATALLVPTELVTTTV